MITVKGVSAMKVALCDDEQIYLDALHAAVNKWAEKEQCIDSIHVYEFKSSEDLLDAVESGLGIDLLFIDIQIPNELSGLEAAKQIRRSNELISIVFVTNYAEYASEGYYVNALRYLRKPIAYERTEECLTIAYKQWKLRKNEYAVIATKKQKLILPYIDILYVETQGHSLLLHMTNHQEIVITYKMQDLIKLLPKHLFTVCHRCYLINLMYVRRITKVNVTMSNGAVIPIGSKFLETVETVFDDYYQGIR